MIGGRLHDRLSHGQEETNYDGAAIYSDPQLTWTQTSYMQPQMCVALHKLFPSPSI
jgi:hypothetical protein